MTWLLPLCSLLGHSCREKQAYCKDSLHSPCGGQLRAFSHSQQQCASRVCVCVWILEVDCLCVAWKEIFRLLDGSQPLDGSPHWHLSDASTWETLSQHHQAKLFQNSQLTKMISDCKYCYCMSQSIGVIVCAAIVSYSATLPTFTSSPISEECFKSHGFLLWCDFGVCPFFEIWLSCYPHLVQTITSQMAAVLTF